MEQANLLQAAQLLLTGFIWSIGLWASMKGFGWALRKTTNLKTPLWTDPVNGVVLFVVVTGWLDYYHLSTRITLTLIALAGIALFLVACATALQKKQFPKIGPKEGIVILTASVIAALGSYHIQYMANWDDVTGYLPVCNEMMISGNSWAPLSLRRALSWGGQYPLQTLGMLFTSDRGGWIYERAMGTWLLLGFALALSRSGKGWVYAGIAILALIAPQTNLNSAPNVLIVLIMLSAWLLRNNPILLGATGAAMLALRTQCLPFLGLLLLFITWEQFKKAGWKTALKNACITGGLILALLTPFALNHLRQFQTPIILLWPGTIDANYLKFQATVLERLDGIWQMTLTTGPLLLALLLGLENKKSRTLCICALIATAIITITMPEYSATEWRRYSWPAITAALLLLSFNWAKTGRSRSAFLALALSTTYPLRELDRAGNKIVTELKATGFDWSEATRAQLTVPEGANLAVLLLQVNGLDFQRNKIFNLDVFPAVGNVPRTPDPEAWKAWTKSQGIDYLMHLDFQETRGGIKASDLFIKPSSPVTDLKNYRRVWFPDRQKIMDCLDKLRTTIPNRKEGAFIIFDFTQNK